MQTTVASVLLTLSALPAVADPIPPAAATPPAPAAKASPVPTGTDNGRFAMTPAGDGFLRLDTRNGGVSFCTVSGGVAQCRSSADERSALEAEIARLSDENAKLKTGTVGASAAPGSPQASSAPLLSNLPKDADVDRALGLLDKVVRGIVRIMKEVDTESN